jgi:hypothetical protein
MQDKKKQPNQHDNGNEIMKNTTCFSVLSKHNVCCQRKKCPHWISFSEGCNCVMITANNGPYTLQDIGKMYGLTRMRICQIEKEIQRKIKEASH